MNRHDAAWDRALDAGMSQDEAGDYAYDVWRGWASPSMPEPVIQDEYDRAWMERRDDPSYLQGREDLRR